MNKKVKQIVAWIGIGCLVFMYIFLLIASLLKVTYWHTLFTVCLASTILIPILLWINIYLFDRIISARGQKESALDEKE